MTVAAYAAELAELLEQRRHVALREARSVVLYAEHELAGAQVGYGVDTDGDDLSGDAPGEWQPAWLVVAHDEATGTPLAADLALAGFPVLVLAETPAGWETDLAAESFERFVRALEVVAAAPEPLDDDARDRVLAAIDRENPSASLVFWESLLEDE